MNTTNIHGVISIELSSIYKSNGNSRTIRVTSKTSEGHKQAHEYTFFGEGADALDNLPKSSDFEDVDKRKSDAIKAEEDNYFEREFAMQRGS